ncbi:hypothetical protein F4859DRAFT_479317 [Xylaria cf. heliscus]|nr:hypothetical protein F4859DRAFT_479317 [Xylaria cf. heliscus]
MRAHSILSLALALLPALTLAQFPSCDPSCQSCGLFCNEGCAAPLDLAKCNECLYCRRESSSCGFVDISGGASNPPDPAYCAQCEQGCHCYIDAKCYDDTTTTIPPSSGAAAPTA